MNAASIADLFLPPVIRKVAGALRMRFSSRRRVEWEYVPEGWNAEQHDPAIKGWNVDSVLEAYKAKWPAFLKSMADTAPFGISPEAIDPHAYDLIQHNTLVSYAYALALASHGKRSLRLLDWGGSIGHYYVISQRIVPEVDINYACKDLPVFVEYGRQLFPEARFYTDETCFEQRYDFVLISGALQYSPDWRADFTKLIRATEGYLFVTNLPTVVRSPSFVFVQRPYQYGYNTEYLGWCVNRQELLRCATSLGLELEREFIIGNRPYIYRAPEQNEYRGFLFKVPFQEIHPNS